MNGLNRDIITMSDSLLAAKAEVELADRQLRLLQRQREINWLAIGGAHRARMRAWQNLATAGEAANWPEILVKGYRLAAHSDAVSADQAGKR